MWAGIRFGVARGVFSNEAGLVIIVTGAWTSGETGASLSALAFNSALPGDEYVVSLGLAVFAFTTILGWSYYSERCTEFLFGPKAVLPFRILWVVAVPNLIALLVLSPVVFKLSKEYFEKSP